MDASQSDPSRKKIGKFTWIKLIESVINDFTAFKKERTICAEVAE